MPWKKSSRVPAFVKAATRGTGQFVMCAFARQQGPTAADAGALEGAAVSGFAVSVMGLTVPDRAGGGFGFERCVDDLDGVDDARVVRSA